MGANNLNGLLDDIFLTISTERGIKIMDLNKNRRFLRPSVPEKIFVKYPLKIIIKQSAMTLLEQTLL